MVGPYNQSGDKKDQRRHQERQKHAASYCDHEDSPNATRERVRASRRVISATTTALVAVDGDEVRDEGPQSDALATSALLQLGSEQPATAAPPAEEPPPAPPASH